MGKQSEEAKLPLRTNSRLIQTRIGGGGALRGGGETLGAATSVESQICPKKYPQALSASLSPLSLLSPLHVSLLSFLEIN
jgi:hypothetical protein